jgi:uncharacterized damage-inducible protein DinB
MTVSVTSSGSLPLFISTSALLNHWQGHRRLTRRVIDVFPEDQLFSFSIGSMRPFGAMALEMIGMVEPMVRGILTSDWNRIDLPPVLAKRDVLRMWDESTATLDRLWPQIPRERFQETMTAFGRWPGKVHDLILYAIDNEVHHRGQGFVYLRALGVEPPAFYARE